MDALKQVSGFTWDDEYGADINNDNLAIWETYIEVRTIPGLPSTVNIDRDPLKRYPKAARFKKRGFAHYNGLKAMMPVRTKSANVFQPTLAGVELESTRDLGWVGSSSGREDGDDEDKTSENAQEPEPVEDPIPDTLFAFAGASMPPASAVMNHKRRFSALELAGSGSTSSASTPGPASKRRHLSALAPDPQVAALNGHLEDFTHAFREATGTSSAGEAASPTRRRQAIRSAQLLEVDLSDDRLVALVDLFTKDVSAADAYMELKREGLRKTWVAKRLEHFHLK